MSTDPKGRVLLLGGNSLADRLASLLLDDGWEVLLSLATDLSGGIPTREGFAVRRGRLDRDGLTLLLKDGAFAAVVDASHPYAEELRSAAPMAALETGVPYLSLLRQETPLSKGALVHTARDHVEAAALAVERGVTILSTIGVNHLPVYLERAREAGVRLVARVLPESAPRCADLGISDNDVIAARGPFSTEGNLRHLRESGAGTLILKDGGAAGGAPEKLEAAERLDVLAILVRRPEYRGTHHHAPETLLASLNVLQSKR